VTPAAAAAEGLAPAAVLCDVAADLCGLSVAGCALQQLCGSSYDRQLSSSGSSSSGAIHLPLHAAVAYRLWLLAAHHK
jgi:hypothetical protein